MQDTAAALSVLKTTAHHTDNVSERDGTHERAQYELGTTSNAPLCVKKHSYSHYNSPCKTISELGEAKYN